MRSSSDLAPLLAASAGGSELGFHQGLVEGWDPATGHNTIRVAGAALTDVPILNTGEAIALEAGHVVALLRFQSSYFILGRVTVPGSEQFASAATDFYYTWARNADIALPATIDRTAVTLEIPVPGWAKRALVTAICVTGCLNTSGANAAFYCRPVISTPAGIDPPTAGASNVGNNRQGTITAAFTRAVDVTDVETITVNGNAWGESIPKHPASQCTVESSAVFLASDVYTP